MPVEITMKLRDGAEAKVRMSVALAGGVAGDEGGGRTRDLEHLLAGVLSGLLAAGARRVVDCEVVGFRQAPEVRDGK